MKELTIIGIRVDHRHDHAPIVQQVLTNYGSKIIGRFGVPDPNDDDGLVTVIMHAEQSDIATIVGDLRNITGVSANSMRL